MNIQNNSTNRSFSTTEDLSPIENTKKLSSFITEFAEPGNIVPHFWFSIIINENGSPDFTAITLLSEIFALYRFAYSSNSCGYANKPTADKTTLLGHTLRISYNHFTNKFHVNKGKVRRAFLLLEELGIIKRDFCNIDVGNGNRCNKLLLTIDSNFFKSCFRNPELDIRTQRDKNTKDNIHPASDLAIKNKNENNDKIQSLQISTHLIRKKNIYKNRSTNFTDLAYTKTKSKSNFLKIYSKKEKIPSFVKKITLGKEFSIRKINNLNGVEQEKHTGNVHAISSSMFRKNKTLPTNQILKNNLANPSFKTQTRQIADFYPLSRKECIQLQAESGREFSLNAMNEILLDMAKRLSDRYFKSKKSFMNYMAKAFRYEMRDAVKISNENFKIRSMQSIDERLLQQQEQYLSTIESSRQVSPEWHLKKKLACVLATNTAYELLRNYSGIRIIGGICQIRLIKPIELTELERATILNQVKATHERLENGRHQTIENLEIIQLAKVITGSMIQERNSYKTTSEGLPNKLPDTLWGKMRQELIKEYGKHGSALDQAWFSKLDLSIEEDKKSIKLKAPSAFIKDWVENNYSQMIGIILGNLGFRLEGFSC